MPYKFSHVINSPISLRFASMGFLLLLLAQDASAQAILQNFSISERVYLNDIVSAKVNLYSNITNMSLDGQDCSVVAYENGTTKLIKWWDTQCRAGEPDVDDEGNWFTYTNCPLSDTMGNYYFTGKITEDDGFEYGKYYRLVINCNRNSAEGVFYVDIPKPADIDKWFDFIRRHFGTIILWLLVGLFAVGVILVGLLYIGGRRSDSR